MTGRLEQIWRAPRAVRRESGKLAAKIGALDAALADLARRSPLAELLSEGVDKLDQG